mgnify:CR=1 FL=1
MVVVLLITGIYGLGIQYNWYGQLEEPGIPIYSSLPDDLVQQKEDRQKEISSSPKQILFKIVSANKKTSCKTTAI